MAQAVNLVADERYVVDSEGKMRIMHDKSMWLGDAQGIRAHLDSQVRENPEDEQVRQQRGIISPEPTQRTSERGKDFGHSGSSTPSLQVRPNRTVIEKDDGPGQDR